MKEALNVLNKTLENKRLEVASIDTSTSDLNRQLSEKGAERAKLTKEIEGIARGIDALKNSNRSP